MRDYNSIFEDMDYIDAPTKDSIKSLLANGNYVLVGDENNYDIKLVKYVFFVKEGMLLAGKLSDSTSEKIIITVETGALFSDEYFNMIWETYISSRGFFFIDSRGILLTASIRPNLNYKEYGKHLKPMEIIAFNDINNPLPIKDDTVLSFYLKNNNDTMPYGINTLKNTLGLVYGINIVNEEDKADCVILIATMKMRAPTKDFYTWYNSEFGKIPEVKGLYEATKRDANKTLIYWTSNVFMSGLFNSDATASKCLIGFTEKLEELKKKKD